MALLDLSPDQWQALTLLGSGVAAGNAPGGFQAASSLLASAPKRAMDMQMAQMQMEQQRQQMADAQAERHQREQFGQAARSAYITPEAAQARSYGPMPDGSEPPTVAPGFDAKAFLSKAYGIDPFKAMQYEQSMVKDDKPITVAPGASLVHPRTFKPMFTAPDKADKPPSSVQEYQFAVGQGFKGTYADYQLTMKRAGASSVSVNTGQKGLDNELKIRSDFRSEPIYKAHQDVQSAHSQITQSLAQGSPAGDLAGATKLMKILDPGSVVRESELGMAMAASGLLDRAQNYAGMVMSGQKLTPTQRKDFKDLADKLHGESVKQYNAKRKEYSSFATGYKLDGERILGPELGGAPPAAAPAGPADYVYRDGKLVPAR